MPILFRLPCVKYFPLNPGILNNHQTFYINRTLVGNKLVDHSDVFGTSPVFIPDLTPDFNRLGKDNCKTRRETFKFEDLVWLVLQVWRHISGFYASVFYNQEKYAEVKTINQHCSMNIFCLPARNTLEENPTCFRLPCMIFMVDWPKPNMIFVVDWLDFHQHWVIYWELERITLLC